MAPKEVCHLTYTWMTSGVSGFLAATLPALSVVRNRLVVCDRSDCVFDAALGGAGIGITSLSTGPFSALRFPRARRAFRAYLAHNPVDAVHLHCSSALELAFLRDAARCGVPVRIAHCHNNGFERTALRAVKQLANRLFRRLYGGAPTRFLGCSDSAVDWICPESRRGDANVIPNGIPTARFAFSADRRKAVRAALGWDDRRILVATGRLSDQKDPLFAVRLLAECRKTDDTAALLFVGDGPLRPQVEALAAQLHLTDHIKITGMTGDVPGYLSAADLFVMPSRYEGFGTAAVEAQAAGLPCLLSDAVPRAAALLPDVRFLPIDLFAWAAACAAIPTSPRAEAAQAVAHAGYDLRATTEKLAAVYRSCLEER